MITKPYTKFQVNTSKHVERSAKNPNRGWDGRRHGHIICTYFFSKRAYTRQMYKKKFHSSYWYPEKKSGKLDRTSKLNQVTCEQVVLSVLMKLHRQANKNNQLGKGNILYNLKYGQRETTNKGNKSYFTSDMKKSWPSFSIVITSKFSKELLLYFSIFSIVFLWSILIYQ